MNNKYTVLIPQNLDLHELTKKYPPEFEFNYDFAHWVISYIIEKTAFKISNMNDAKDLFIPLYSPTLLKLNKEYKKHMEYLTTNFINMGNVLWRENYSIGKSFGYKLSPYYFNVPFKCFELKDINLIKKIKSKRKMKLSETVRTNFKFMLSFFNPDLLTIEHTNALKSLEDSYTNKMDFSKYMIKAVKIIKIQNGEYFFTHVPQTDGRFHNSMTLFPKNLRKYLKYDNEKLGEIDISASIPVMLYYLLSNIDNIDSNLYNVITNNKPYYINYMFVKNAVSLDNREIQRLGDLVLRGEFYGSFIPDFDSLNIDGQNYYQWQSKRYGFRKKWKKQISKNKDCNGVNQSGFLSHENKKKILKTNLLSMLNAKCGRYKYEEQIFKAKFPTIYEFIQSLKKKEHKPFSHMMFQIESLFMLKLIAKKLNNQFRKKIPFFTLHDCIITTESNIQFVKKFMEDNFAKEMGFVPVLKEQVFE